ncbi:MAG TPA: hypothetical protein VGN20_02595 [Mucilaginibacter sp.]|jgi:hypothetical protein
MAWFNYLKESGEFDPEKNPRPIVKEQGYMIPHWDALNYLEKLASKFADNKEMEFVDGVLEIITNISAAPVDNYHTWYRLLHILDKMPNDKIPITLFDFMPVWVTSNFDTSIVTTVLTSNLLPKFLPDNATALDIEKATHIFENLFEIRKRKQAEGGPASVVRQYYCPYSLDNLRHGLLDLTLLAKLSHYFDQDPFRLLADKINILLRDNKGEIDLTGADAKYVLKTEPEPDSLTIILEKQNSSEKTIVHKESITNYFDKQTGWEVPYFNRLFNQFEIDKDSVISALEKISFILGNDFESLMGLGPISDLQKDPDIGYEALHTFALILRNWLKTLAVDDSEKAKGFLNLLICEKRYDLPYFKRIVLFIVAQNWAELKLIFWKLVERDTINIFSIDTFKVELYYLLKQVSATLQPSDVKKIKGIIEAGPVGELHYSNTKETWAHRWYDALQEHPDFSEAFKSISSNLSRTKDYEEDGRVQFRIGHVAPYTADELLNMSVDEVANIVLTFKNIDRWNDPTIEGLGESLSLAIEASPQRFVLGLSAFNKVIYFYAYQILWGLLKAVKKGESLDWAAILRFCNDYISSNEFQEGALFSEDEPRASKEWVYGHIGNLISDATKDEQEGFDNQCLKNAKNILTFIASKLSPTKTINKDNFDFVMHSLNSTQGKTLRALLDCALKEARMEPNAEQPWSGTLLLKNIFANTMQRGIVDGYILEGMYLSQFMFLDDAWLRTEIISHQSADFFQWAAFMSGVAFGKPISGDYYSIMLPHYQRAVEANYIDTHHQSGILRHLLAFYFWDYDPSFEETLLYKCLNNAELPLLTSAVQLLNQQQHAIKTLPDIDYNHLSVKFFTIWKLLIEKFENTELTNKRDVQQMIHYMEMIRSEDLDAEITELILKTIALSGEFAASVILRQLLQFVKAPIAAPQVARILAQINYSSYFEQDVLKQLVVYLYDQGQTQAANEIVTKLTIKGHDYLKPIYFQYNT